MDGARQRMRLPTAAQHRGRVPLASACWLPTWAMRQMPALRRALGKRPSWHTQLLGKHVCASLSARCTLKPLPQELCFPSKACRSQVPLAAFRHLCLTVALGQRGSGAEHTQKWQMRT